MGKVRVSCFTISLDGYGAGAHQNLENPLGVGGEELHAWMVETRTFRRLYGKGDGGTTGPDDDFTERGLANVGAWILGRNMFGPVRGAWPDASWRGWWGEEPPYHCDVFVLTHHARESFSMKGGTTFHFVTGGAPEALQRAKAAAKEKDVRVGGGPATIRQYLREGQLDELHIAISPVLLGSGESLFEGIDVPALGYRCAEHVTTTAATHVVLRK